MSNLLPAELSAALTGFNLKARLIVEGFLTGLHKSPYHGFSAEFSDYRQYNPGDPAWLLDWKVLAKTDRYYVKRFEEDTNLKAHILLDCSASMGYGSGGTTKLEYARLLAAALAWLLLHQQDACGLVTFSDKVQDNLPPRAMRAWHEEICRVLVNAKAGGTTATANVLHALAEGLKRRGLIILITDLLDDPESLVQALQHFRHERHEVLVFNLVDPQEEKFNFKSTAEFVDAETGEKLLVNPWQLRRDYLQMWNEHTTVMREKCLENRIDYHFINTGTPFEQALLQFLIKRRQLG